MSGFDVAGCRALVTGASSGIGRELALQLSERGATVAVAARRRPLLEGLADEVEGTGRPRPAVIDVDLSLRGSAAALAEQASAALGHVDLLVNNAGSGVGGSQWAVGDADPAREAVEVNYWSPLGLVHALVPGMRERGRGAVVNVTSMAQINTWPMFGAYAATKSALATATETLRLELAGSPVHVLEAIPGPVDTAVQGETRLAPGIERVLDRVPLGTPAEMARRTLRALERGRSRVIYPRAAAMSYVLPTLARAYTRRAAGRTAAELEPDAREGLMSIVVRTGSQGDPQARAAREAWDARPR